MRKAHKYVVVMVGFGVMFASCKKHTVEIPEANDPVFHTEGTLNGQSFELVAGDDNAYMHTMVMEENGVDVFSGKISNGDFSIELGIFSGFVDMQGKIDLDDLPEALNFSRVSTTALATLDKDLFPNAQLISEVAWYVNGVPKGINYHEIDEPGIYDVRAVITFTDMDTAELSSELIVGYKRHANAKIKHYLDINGKLSAWLDDPIIPVEKIRWFLDGQFVSDDADFSMDINQENHILSAEISFENGVVRSKNMLVDGSLSGKFIDDLTVFENSTLALLNQDFNIRLKIEQDGETLSSAYADNSGVHVEIISVEYYTLNALGNIVYKVRAHISAKVNNAQGDFQDVDFETVFGIALPQ